MKKIVLFAGLAVLLFSACQETPSDAVTSANTKPAAVSAGLQLNLEANPEWEYENLRLYPIETSGAAVGANMALAALKTLDEGMQTKGFRITEKKQFGRERDNWYNGLTVQNKSQDTVFLMSGDVVTGGNQDRVIAHDDVILPRSVKNIEVFCVEHGRSSYYDPAASPNEKQVGAFRGYYNVASPRVRQAVHSGNQQGVWDAVEKVTTENKAHSSTSAYAALETANEQKAKREAYLQFFDGKFNDRSKVVGMVAVCNGKVVGVDIFGHPELFRKKYKALLHGYAADAAIAEKSAAPAEHSVQEAFRQVAQLSSPKSTGTESAGRFGLGEHWLHLYRK
ncbi:MAG: hypothetical protein IT260_10705 [Saprospiraceae bacterium]|nr:hypothetical protein [Saprospiraceae bacterium]